MKTVGLMNHKDVFIMATTHEFNRVLAVPFRAMKGGGRSPKTHCSGEFTGSWVLEMLSCLAWMG